MSQNNGTGIFANTVVYVEPGPGSPQAPVEVRVYYKAQEGSYDDIGARITSHVRDNLGGRMVGETAGTASFVKSTGMPAAPTTPGAVALNVLTFKVRAGEAGKKEAFPGTKPVGRVSEVYPAHCKLGAGAAVHA